MSDSFFSEKPAAAAPPDQFCCSCDRSLCQDEKALTKKMINRGATRFFCLTCLARHFEVSEDILHQKIREFREMGCTLFQPPET